MRTAVCGGSLTLPLSAPDWPADGRKRLGGEHEASDSGGKNMPSSRVTEYGVLWRPRFAYIYLTV